MVGNDGLLGDVGVSLGTDAGRRGQAEWKEGRDHENRGSWAGGSQRAVWEVIRINYSRSITRAIKVRAKRLLITKEANLSVSLAHPSRPFRIPVSQCPARLALLSFQPTTPSRQRPLSIRLARNSTQNSAS